MNMNMIEKVARALYAHYDWGIDNGMGAIMHGCAKAAILAMREPSEGMIDVGFQLTGDPCWPEDYKKAWEASIDAALKEE